MILVTILSPSSAVGQSVSVAAVGPTRIDFGRQVFATMSKRRLILLTNAGSDPLPVTRIGLTGDFAVNHECPSLLPAGEGCRIWVVFQPTAAGARAGRLTITDEAGTQSVVLFGMGLPVLEASRK